MFRFWWERRQKMAKVSDVANYIVHMTSVDPLKLQKLLYYSQGVFMAKYPNKLLFPEAIEAWDYGPVIPSIYKAYKKFGFSDIKPSNDVNFNKLERKEQEIVDMVLEYYGSKSGLDLMNRTHRETPWKTAYEKGKNNILNNAVMQKHFSENIEFD